MWSTSASVATAAVVATAIVIVATAEQEVEYNKDNNPFATAIVVITSEHKLICSFQILYYKKFLPALHIY